MAHNSGPAVGWPILRVMSIMQNEYTKEQTFFISGRQGQLEVLASDVLKNGTAQPILIGVVCHPHPLFHGTMNNKVVTTIIKTWHDLEVPTVRFNFRGVGKSEGRYGDGIGETEDLQTVLDWLRSQNPNSEFWLGGFSFGSYISMGVASRNQYPIQALLSIAPPVHLFNFAAVAIPTCPWVIIQGQQDEIVSYASVSEWYSEAQLKTQNMDIELLTLPRASHFFHGQLIELKAMIRTAMEPLLKK